MAHSPLLDRLLPPALGPEDRRSARVVAIIALSVTPAALLTFLISLSWGEPVVSVSIALGAVLFASSLVLLRRGCVAGAGLLMTYTGLVVVTISATLGQGIHDYAVIAYPVIVVVSGLVGRSRAAFFVSSALTVTAVSWLAVGDIRGWYAPHRLDPTQWSDWVLMLVFLVVTVGAMDLLSGDLRRSIADARRELADRRQAEEKFFKAFSASPVTLTISRLVDGTFLEVNDAFEKETGYSRAEVIGRTELDLHVWVDPSARERWMPLVRRDGRVEVDGLSFRMKDGRLRTCDVSSVLLQLAGEECALSAIVDVTARVEAEAERSRLTAQLFQSQKLESLGTLAAGIAHDFNNILTIIAGHVEMLQLDYPAEGEAAGRIDAVRTAASRGTQLVRQLLTLARKTDSRRTSVKVNDVVSEVVRLIGETFPKTVVVALDLDPGLPPIEADHSQLHQVLLNLAVNARDAMPGGGTLGFGTRLVAGADVAARHPGADAASYVRLGVSDTGTGIDEETLPHIFDPFFTTKGVGKGTGVGLSVVRGIAEAHGGYVDVSSRAGQGARFDVMLPVSASVATSARQDARTVRSILGGPETILLVEDEAMTRDFVVSLLSRKGYRVITAQDGADGVDTFRRLRGEIDLVISDFGLPKLSGREVFERIRAVDTACPFVLISGFVEPDTRESFLALGVSQVLDKPFNAADLLETIRRVLDDRDGAAAAPPPDRRS
jgi:two-component system, cell cycle sensor histidine kinase and response regulator CckA